MRIVRLANFVTPTSGGLRTALYELGAGYAAAGHEPVLVIPGAAARDEPTPAGRIITLPAPVIPGLGGYRAVIGRRRLRRLLEELAPDRIEVSDRTTLRWTGAWARARGICSVMVSHESLSALLRLYGPLGWLADPLNRATATHFDTVVCTTACAAAEFARLGVRNLAQVPLGVDLETFDPGRFDSGLRSRLAATGQALLVHCGRLSPRSGRTARSEPSPSCAAAAFPPSSRWPATDRCGRNSCVWRATSRSVSSATSATATPWRTCSRPRTWPSPPDRWRPSVWPRWRPSPAAPRSWSPATAPCRRWSARRGAAVRDEPAAYADAIEVLLSDPARRSTARAQAERYGWPAAVRGFLHAHGLIGAPR